MDYSLLLGIAEGKAERNKEEVRGGRIIYSDDENLVYFLSIIDIFQKYNLSKSTEHLLKSIKLSGKQSGQVSSIPPKPYADRFHHFIVTHFIKN